MPAADSNRVVLPLPELLGVDHLALVLGALCDAPARLQLGSLDRGARGTVFALTSLGAELMRDGTDFLCVPVAALRPSLGMVHSGDDPASAAHLVVQCARLARRMDVVVHGGHGLASLGPLVEALTSLGASIAPRRSRRGHPTLRIRGPVRPGDLQLPESARLDHVAALLVGLAGLESASTLGLSRVPAGLTGVLELLGACGLTVDWTPDGLGLRVPGGQRPRPGRLERPIDPVGVAMLRAAGLFAQRPVAVMAGAPSALAPLLQAVENGEQYTVSDDIPLLDLRSLPELLPVASVLSLLSPAPVELHCRGQPELPVLSAALQRVGARVERSAAGLRVHAPDGIRGRVVLRCQGIPTVHRALRLLSLREPAVMVDSADEDGAWPDFEQLLEGLRQPLRGSAA